MSLHGDILKTHLDVNVAVENSCSFMNGADSTLLIALQINGQKYFLRYL